MELVNKQRNFSIPEVTPGKYVAYDNNMSVILCNILRMITVWVRCYAPYCICSQYECDLMQHVAYDHSMSVVLCNMLHKITKHYFWQSNGSGESCTFLFYCHHTFASSSHFLIGNENTHSYLIRSWWIYNA